MPRIMCNSRRGHNRVQASRTVQTSNTLVCQTMSLFLAKMWSLEEK